MKHAPYSAIDLAHGRRGSLRFSDLEQDYCKTAFDCRHKRIYLSERNPRGYPRMRPSFQSVARTDRRAPHDLGIFGRPREIIHLLRAGN
jgi:hypothetical protein